MTSNNTEIEIKVKIENVEPLISFLEKIQNLKKRRDK
jgi:hypothetical protein